MPDTSLLDQVKQILYGSGANPPLIDQITKMMFGYDSTTTATGKSPDEVNLNPKLDDMMGYTAEQIELMEIFDSRPDYKHVGTRELLSSTQHNYQFNHGEHRYGVTISHHEATPNHAEVTFYKHTQRGPTMAMQHDDDGQAHKIVGKVIHIVRDHVKKHKLKSIGFGSDTRDKGRTKLYKSLARKHGGSSWFGGSSHRIPVNESYEIQQLNELFDTPVKYTTGEHHHPENGDHHYVFHHKSKSVHVNIEHSEEDEDTAKVEFYKKTHSGKHIYSQTGDHPQDAHKILSGVHHIVKDHVAKYPEIKHIRFTGSGHSREKLYDRISRKHKGRSSRDVLDTNYEIPVNQHHEHVAFTFGRFSVPSKGHSKLFEKLKEEAGTGPHYVFASHTQDSERNPLSWNTKVSIMEQCWPDLNICQETNVKTLFQAISLLESEGFKSATLVVGQDRYAEFSKLLETYQKDYSMTIGIVAVPRTSDDESATKMREAVINEDFETFAEMFPEDTEEGLAEFVYDVVGENLNELFDKPHEYKKDTENSTDYRHIYNFHHGDDHFETSIHHHAGPKKGTATVVFNDQHGETGVTGRHKGSAHKVISTVHHIVKDHIAKHPEIKHVRFTGDGDHEKLYSKITKKRGGVEGPYTWGKEFKIPVNESLDVQQLNELFDTPVEYETGNEHRTQYGAHHYVFHHKGRPIHVKIDHGSLKKPTHASVRFHAVDVNGWSEYEQTHDHPKDAHKILSGVHHIVKDHIKNHPTVKHVTFSGEGESRTKLYDRLARKNKGRSKKHPIFSDVKKYSVPVNRNLKEEVLDIMNESKIIHEPGKMTIGHVSATFHPKSRGGGGGWIVKNHRTHDWHGELWNKKDARDSMVKMYHATKNDDFMESARIPSPTGQKPEDERLGLDSNLGSKDDVQLRRRKTMKRFKQIIDET